MDEIIPDNQHFATDENIRPKAAFQSSMPWVKGYFAFPPTADGRVLFTFSQRPQNDLQVAREQADREAEAEQERRTKELAWEERCQRDAQVRQERLERERAEALVGEMDWVRAGGSLRDANGRRDVVRTEQLRAEIRLQDEEKRLMAQWDAYEARWRALLASSSTVSFRDVPWPTPTAPSSVDELTNAAIADFIFGPLQVRKNTITRRERIRASLLRWHPDKVYSILVRTVEEDTNVVREGVNTVFRCLKALQDAERGN